MKRDGEYSKEVQTIAGFFACKEAVLKAVMDTRRIITVEDHTILGGLGSAVAEVMAEAGKGCAFKRLGIQDQFAPIGLHEDIMSTLGIDSNGIIEAVREVMKADFEEDNDWDDEFWEEHVSEFFDR